MINKVKVKTIKSLFMSDKKMDKYFIAHQMHNFKKFGLVLFNLKT